MNKNIMPMVLVGGLLAVGVGNYIVFSQKPTPEVAKTPITTQNQVPQGIAVGEPNPSAPEGASGKLAGGTFMRVMGDAIYPAAQRPGTTMKLMMASFTKPGFVAVYTSVDGKPGTLLGASALLETGSQEGFPVTLSKTVEHGAELVAVVYHDNGDGKFDASSDVAAKSAEGDMIMSTFSIDKEADLNPIIMF